MTEEYQEKVNSIKFIQKGKKTWKMAKKVGY